MNYNTPKVIYLTHILETLLKRIEMRPERKGWFVMMVKQEVTR